MRAACAALASKLKGIKAVFVSLALCRSLLFSLPHVQTHRLLQLSLPLKLIQMSMHSLDSSICIPHTPWSGGRVINRNDISLGDGRCPPNPMWTNPFHSHRNRSLGIQYVILYHFDNFRAIQNQGLFSHESSLGLIETNRLPYCSFCACEMSMKSSRFQARVFALARVTQVMHDT